MTTKDHEIFDIRQKKPKVYAVEDINQDITVQQIETYKNGKGEVRFATPNVTAIFLNVSKKALDNAKNLHNSLLRSKEAFGGLHVFTEAETIMLYDYFENIQTSIITLYSAIESLVNILIPDNFVLEVNNNKGIKEIWDKSAIERWKQTREKLKDILPRALNIPSPTSYNCWSRFTQFEDIRNDIIHIKSTSLTNKQNDEKLMGILISSTIFSKIDAGKELIKELSRAVPNHYEMPMLKNTETIIAIKIKTWEDLKLTKVS